MNIEQLITLVRNEERLRQLADYITRYPNEPVINLFDMVFPEIELEERAIDRWMEENAG